MLISLPGWIPLSTRTWKTEKNESNFKKKKKMKVTSYCTHMFLTTNLISMEQMDNFNLDI